MNPESVQFLWETLNGPDGMLFLVSFVVVMPLFALLVFWAYRRKVHPVTLWAVITLILFYGSQIFPENRSQALQLALCSPIASAIATWGLFRFTSLGKHRREEQ